MARVYTLAHVDGSPDVEFPSLRALGAYVVGHRNAQGRDASGQTPEIALRGANIAGATAGLEGACISVRLRRWQADGRPEGGPGQLVGYAFLPEYRYVTTAALESLMAAILAAADEAERREAGRRAA